jgi:hypothetical protein
MNLGVLCTSYFYTSAAKNGEKQKIILQKTRKFHFLDISTSLTNQIMSFFLPFVRLM